MTDAIDPFNLAGPIRTAILEDGPIVALLGVFKDEASVHTRRPAPQGATYPMAMVSPDIATANADFLSSEFRTVIRDVSVYGEQPGQYRTVEQAAYLIRRLFHRKRLSIQAPGLHIVDIVASGPIPAPVDDEKLVGRLVSLSIRFQPLPE
jgi:hypothetical protein